MMNMVIIMVMMIMVLTPINNGGDIHDGDDRYCDHVATPLLEDLARMSRRPLVATLPPRSLHASLDVLHQIPLRDVLDARRVPRMQH